MWRSANSTCFVVGFCSVAWCWQCAHVKFQLPLDVLGTDATASSSPLPSCREVIGNDCMHRQCSRDVQTTTFPWTHTDTFAGTFTETSASASAHCCTYMLAFADVSVNVDNVDGSATHANTSQAYTQHPRWMRTLPCVKLRTLVSHYVSNCRRRWW